MKFCSVCFNSWFSENFSSQIFYWFSYTSSHLGQFSIIKILFCT